jgi:exodeoxyribonuclease V gamma subunit
MLRVRGGTRVRVRGRRARADPRALACVAVLHIHRSARADVLAGALAELLATPPPDPFAPDLVAVPTRGMERWLAQTMSAVLGASPDRRDGVCANVLFPTPHRLLSDAVATASGIDPDGDPWLPERLTWTVLEVVEEHLGAPWLHPLAAYLGAVAPTDPVRRERRLSIVRHLATLFDRYALNRPAMLSAWSDGRDTGGGDRRLPEGARWQAELWRRLRSRIALPDPAHRREDACARIVADPATLELPSRITLFGLTRLPVGHLRVLRALAAGREVHLFLLHPSAALWDTIASAGPEAQPAGLRRALDRSAGRVSNNLLASWGRDAREMQLVLGDPDPSTGPNGPSVRGELHPLPDTPPATLLERLQDDIRADRRPPGPPLPGAQDTRAPLLAADHSVAVHAGHGRVRQVEILRDAILHALEDDETLEPRDVIVMCPDVEAFAPLIQATFGSAGPLDGEEASAGAAGRSIDLRVRLADRSLTQTNPLLGVLAALMELVERRITASEVLDLADRAPVRRRFHFDDEDLTRMQDWITGSGIRWGLDAAHRGAYKLDAVADGTWRTGLDRLLLGATMTEDGQRLFSGVLPLDDVDSRAIELAGRIAELIARLQTTLDSLAESRPLREWAQALAGAADALARTTGRDRWQRAELQRILDEMAAESGEDSERDLAPAEIRAHIAARLAGRPTRANFRTGHLTVCTLTPMRSVPHRVVCLLGLDDEEFPRRTPRDGDDLMLDDPHVGERDPRSEDRQLLLDALLAATERLIITYAGNDERTNVERPPAVPVGELLDAVDATVRTEDPAVNASKRILVRHPLQPFDPRNFETGPSGESPWSFDDVALDGARALTAPRAPARPFLSEPLPARASAEVDLDDLVAFAQQPVRAFLRRRLGVSLYDGDDEVADALPIELDGLERWGVANRMLESQLRGTTLRTAAAAEKVRGTLPPGRLGDRVIASVKDLVGAIATQAGEQLTPGADRDPFDVRIDLEAGRTLTGTVSGVNGDVLLSASFSRVSPRHRMAAWVRFLALSAAHPEEPFRAVTIGRGSGRDDVRVCVLRPLADDPAGRREIARRHLDRLVELYVGGMREPLPIFTATSAAWSEARLRGQDPEPDALKQWETYWAKNHRIEGEDADLSHQLVLGGRRSLAELLETAPAPEESGEGWATEETSRLGRLARRYWDDLALHEERTSR